MHEFSIIDHILRICEETAQQHGLRKVTEIKVCIGKMRQVVPDTMHFIFEVASQETKCEAAHLDLEFLPILMMCKDCNHEFAIEDGLFECSACGSGSLKITQGQELYIKSIEGEP